VYPKRNILIVGAGEAGRALLSDFARTGRARLVAGFLDDDPGKAGTTIQGKPVIAGTGGLLGAIEEYSVGQVIIAMPSAGHASIRAVISNVLKEYPRISIHIIPSAEKYFDAVPIAPSLRRFSFDEMFERDEISVDLASISGVFSGATVMVTGAGGSIGSELCRQLMKFGIKKLVAMGRGEHSIYCLVKSLGEYLDLSENKPQISYRIADVTDAGTMEREFALHRPDIVFHAAAHKHVPLMESNEGEAVRNNVGGTRNVLEASSRHGVGRFILVSTDKAVRPSSVMGATKRIAEILCRHYNGTGGLKTSVVRFGNVVESRGSVIPLFREQIERGGPVTVTDPEVTRFFMTIPEAALLVLNAAAYAAGGDIFMLEMGKQHRLDDIARKLIELYGYAPDRDIRVSYTGLRPGEKLHEELMYDSETSGKTGNDAILRINDAGGAPGRGAVERFLRDDLPSIAERSGAEIRGIIHSLVPDFSGTGPGGCDDGTRLIN